MALFSRIFQNRRNTRSSSGRGLPTERERWGVPKLERSRIRLVLFKDHDLKGRSLLFDSSAVHRVNAQENAQNTSKFYVQLGKNLKPPPEGGGGREEDGRETSGGSLGSNSHPGFAFSKPGSDTKMLGEMMYGSVAMSYKGSTFKVHSIRSPPQVMMTKVFRLNSGSKESTLEGESLDGDSIQSVPGDVSTSMRINNPSSPQIAHSVPMDVPSPPKRDVPDFETEDSGFSNSLTSSTSSLCTSLPSPSSSASNSFTSSLNSMHRRLMRSQTTSLEYNLMKRASDDSMVAPSPLPASKRPPNIGAGIIFLLPTDELQAKELQYFLFSHIMLLESHINILCRTIEKACCTKKMFVRNVYEAFEAFVESMRDLYLTPRLSQPVWLSMTSGNTMHRIPMCQRFLKELMVCLDKYDTKSTKFFVSTLVTGVLTHHLAWVATVTPAWATPSSTYLDKHSAKWLDAIAKSHPYNPLWAQLSDLYGAIGFPTRLSRTVVIGRKSEVVNRMLYILSYFIRCSEVVENSDQQPVVMETEYLSEEFEENVDESVDENVFKSALQSTHIDCDDFAATNTMLLMDDEHLNAPTQADSTSSASNKLKCISLTDPLQHYPDHQDLSIQSYDQFYTRTSLSSVNDSDADIERASSTTSKFLPQPAIPVCDNDLSLDSSGELSHQVPCSQDLSVINNCELNSVTLRTKNEMVDLTFNPLECNNDVSAISEDLTTCALLETDFSFLPQDLRRIRLEHGDNCMESSADSTSTLTQSSDDLQLSKASSILKPVSTTEIDIPHENCSFTCQLSPASPVKDRLRETARNVGRVNIVENDVRRTSISPPLLPNAKSPASADNEHPRILVDGSTLATDTDLNCHDGRPREGSTLSETSSSRSRDDLDSGIFESAFRYATDCSMSRDSSADNLYRMGGAGDHAISTPNSDDSETKDIQVSPDRKLQHSSPPVGKIRVAFERSSSIFDEYFHDDGATIGPPDILPSSTAKYKRMASIEGSNSIFDEYLSEPCPDLTGISGKRSSKEFQKHVNVFDEYFLGDDETAIPEEEILQQVPDAFSLMNNQQPIQEQDDDGEVTTPTNTKRPSSLNLDLCSTRSGGDFHRQNTVISSSSKGFITPTPGMGRKRHQSSVSTTSIETVDFFRRLRELPMPRSEDASEDGYSIQNFERNFGRSLLAGYSDHYLSDFVLHGTKDVNFQAKLHSDLTMAVQEPVLDEPIAEAACILADTDKWSVRLQTCQCSSSDRVLSKEMTASRYILDTMESVHDLWKLKMSPEFCLMHLEDKLQEIYFKSKVIAEYIRSHQKVSLKELSKVLDFDESDLPLMLAVAGTHSSLLTLALMT